MSNRYREILDPLLLTCRALVESQGYRLEVEWLAPGTCEGRVTCGFGLVQWRGPEPESVLDLAICLHECGHVLHGDGREAWDRFYGRIDNERTQAEIAAFKRDREPEWEVRASQFALRLLHLHGLPHEGVYDFFCKALVQQCGMGELEAWRRLRTEYDAPLFTTSDVTTMPLDPGRPCDYIQPLGGRRDLL